MYVMASKLLWPLLQPANLLLLLLVLGAAQLLGRRTSGVGRGLVVLAAALLLLTAVLPLGNWVVQPLEERFPPAPPPSRVDGLIVLGGSVSPDLTAARGQPALNDAAERLTAFVALARRYPSARLVFSGGTGSLIPGRLSEADVARVLFTELGIAADRVVFQGASRNTYEDAMLSHALVQPEAGETWLLITSARHMPRAVGVFRRAGWPVVPYAVDYRTTGDVSPDLDFGLADGLNSLDDAAKEWVALVVYRVLGRTDTLIPGPA
ncbi:MAG: YdcF family protein [Alphaproteobacteria bacterium]|nr:YdcF family protein [Alphaproteobacteria bacterium]